MTDPKLDLKWRTALNIWIGRHRDAVKEVRRLQEALDRRTFQLDYALSIMTEEQLTVMKDFHDHGSEISESSGRHAAS